MSEFQTPVDIANRALQRVGALRINPAVGFNENSKQASETSFNYGKLRRAELQRNVWTFATKRAALRPINTNTMLVQPTLWNASVTYFVGSIVQDSASTLWESVQRDNLNNRPGTNLQAWVPYFGPLTAALFDSSFSYYASELVYTLKGDGTFNVYKSMMSGNAVHPALPNQWSVDTIYKTDDVVNVFLPWQSIVGYSQGQTVMFTDGNAYTSLINSNTGNPPATSGAKWAQMPTLTLTSQLVPVGNPVSAPPPMLPGTTPIDEWNILTSYGIGSFVIWNTSAYVSLINNNAGNYPTVSADWALCTGGTIYQSKVDLNQGNPPASSPTQWSTSFVLGGGNALWMQVGGAAFPNGVNIIALQLTYPIGAGPSTQSWTKNVYRLPANYLRRAPQDPKGGVTSWLGAPGYLLQKDWTFEGNYLVSWDSSVIVFRFVADMQNVPEFPDMFSEMLSCSIALEVCETLTQSAAKKQGIAQEYKLRRQEAMMVSGIEKGAELVPLDDLIACRL